MVSWKRVALISASAGAGAAVVGFVILGVILWLSARPKDWNTDAVKAHFENLNCSGEQETLIFLYTFESATDSDYEIENLDFSAEFFVNIKNQDSPRESLFQDSRYELHLPIYLPAKQRVSVIVHRDEYQCPPNLKGEELKEHFRKEWSNIAGFVLFDKTRRYQINFPKGW